MSTWQASHVQTGHAHAPPARYVALRPLLYGCRLQYKVKADNPDQMGKELPAGLMPVVRQFSKDADLY